MFDYQGGPLFLDSDKKEESHCPDGMNYWVTQNVFYTNQNMDYQEMIDFKYNDYYALPQSERAHMDDIKPIRLE